MLDVNAADVVSIVIVALSALCIYLAYDITRITNGAPKAWYLIILAFAVLLVRRATEAYFDILSPGNDVDTEEAIVTLVVVFLFVVGLFMLNRTFREQLKVAQESSDQSLEKNSSNHRFSKLLLDGVISSSTSRSPDLKTISLKLQM